MSRKRAHPLLALLRADRRMLRRHGITFLYAFLALLYAAALRFLLPQDQRPLVLTLLLLTDPATLSLFFMGAVVLYEKNQHLPAALYASAVRPRTWAFSKCLVATVTGTLVGCFVLWFSDPAVLRLDAGGVLWDTIGGGDTTALLVTAACMALGGFFFTCLSIPPAVLVKSLNGFILAVVAVEVVFLLPAVIDLFQPLPEYAGYHPGVLLARALYRPRQAAAWLNSPEKLWQCAAYLGWMLLGWIGAVAFAGRLLRGRGGEGL